MGQQFSTVSFVIISTPTARDQSSHHLLHGLCVTFSDVEARPRYLSTRSPAVLTASALEASSRPLFQQLQSGEQSYIHINQCSSPQDRINYKN